MQITTAETITVGDATVATRNAVAIWLLTFLTLGIFGIWWWYQVNRELRDYSLAVTRPFAISPVLAAVLFALWPAGIVWTMLTTYMGARRIRHAQEWVEAPKHLSPIVAALLVPLLFAQTIYLQNALNDVWRRAAAGAGPPPDYTFASGQGEQLRRQSEIGEADRGARYR
jgi:ABC-type sulfate transport system permease subunit